MRAGYVLTVLLASSLREHSFIIEAEQCCVCLEAYAHIARAQGPAFGVRQCHDGHHLCKACWDKERAIHNLNRCPVCRAVILEPITNRVLQNQVLRQPAVCKWAGCCQQGLSIATVAEHERRCLLRSEKCVCRNFEGTFQIVADHRKTCFTHIMTPLMERIECLQIDAQERGALLRDLRECLMEYGVMKERKLLKELGECMVNCGTKAEFGPSSIFSRFGPGPSGSESFQPSILDDEFACGAFGFRKYF